MPSGGPVNSAPINGSLGADQLALLRKERVPMHGDRVVGRAEGDHDPATAQSVDGGRHRLATGGSG